MLADRLARWSDRRRWEERGAAAIVLALVVCFVVVPMGAFAVDIGMQRVARRDAQAIADTAGLDAARALNSCATVGGVAQTQAQVDSCLTTVARTSSSLDQGAVGTGAPTVSARAGYVDPSGTWASNQGLGCTGSASLTGYFQYPVPSGKSANAALVTVSNKVDFGLAKAMGISQGGVCRSSLANLKGSACFEIGSFAAQINSGNSAILGPLLGALGTGIDTTALSYKGLAQTELSIAGLQTALGAGSVDSLLTTTTTLDGFYLAEVNALKAQGNTAEAAVLDALRLKLGPVAKAKPIVVGDLLGLSQGNGSALGASVNALGLVGGAAEIANGSSFLSVPSLNVNVPGVGTGANTSLSVIQTPKPVCDTPNGGKVARNAQIELNTSITVLKSFPKILGLGVSAGPITLDLKTASATGQLTGLNCAASPPSMTITGTNDLLPITATVPITLDGGILGSINLQAIVTTNPSDPATWSVDVAVPTNLSTTGTPKTTPTGNLNLASATAPITAQGSTGLLGILGITLADLVSAVGTNLIGPLETTVLAPLLTSLSSILETTLGLTIDGSDVYSDSISCNAPQLVG